MRSVDLLGGWGGWEEEEEEEAPPAVSWSLREGGREGKRREGGKERGRQGGRESISEVAAIASTLACPPPLTCVADVAFFSDQ